MVKVISVLNQKGGVGKTTITAHLAYGLNNKGYSVLLVDSDPQGSLRDWSATSDGELLSVIGLDRETLSKDIDAIKNNYDFVVIDGRAKAEQMTGAAVRASDFVLIPVAPSALDIWGASDLVEAIKARHEVTEGRPLTRFLINLAREGTRLKDEVVAAVEKNGFKTLNVVLHLREIYRQTMGEGLTVYQSKNQGAKKEMENLVNEVLELMP